VLSAIGISLLYVAAASLGSDIAKGNELIHSAIELLVVGIAEAIFVAWICNWQIKGERVLTILVHPILVIATTILFFNLALPLAGAGFFERLNFFITNAFILLVLTYVLHASVNVLNLSSIQNIPLAQAGKSANYIITLIISYLGLAVTINSSFSIILQGILVFFMIGLFTNTALWTINLEKEQRLTATLGVSLIVLLAFFILSLWPIETFYLSLIMALIYYMILGIALEVREVLPRWIWLEYGAIFSVIVLILLLIGNWGINGTIF